LAGPRIGREERSSIEELLAARKIDMHAQQEVRSLKQFPKTKGTKHGDVKLFPWMSGVRAMTIGN
jgi:hypothetical protein